ncbi:HTH-type transcriptional regulator PgrR [compost metagenome]|jgi:DNA-binding transcriptional LysR family regulator
MDSLGLLNAFVLAAENRSFTVAGRRLGVSSSAVGKAVARLEERLGVRLLHRSTRTITPTPEGALFLERCRRIFAEIEVAERELSETQSAPRGKLRLSLPLVGMRLMPTLTAFMRAYPTVELDLDFTDRLVKVIEEGFDAVIRIGEISDSRLMSRTLCSFSHHIVASPDYLERHGIPHRPDDLKTHACLHYKYPTTGKLDPWPLKRSGRAPSLELPETAVANTIDPLIAMAEQGLGIACLPRFTIARELADGSLVPVLQKYVRDSRTFHILWPGSRHPSPKVRAFVDFIALHLATDKHSFGNEIGHAQARNEG